MFYVSSKRTKKKEENPPQNIALYKTFIDILTKLSKQNNTPISLEDYKSPNGSAIIRRLETIFNKNGTIFLNTENNVSLQPAFLHSVQLALNRVNNRTLLEETINLLLKNKKKTNSIQLNEEVVKDIHSLFADCKSTHWQKQRSKPGLVELAFYQLALVPNGLALNDLIQNILGLLGIPDENENWTRMTLLIIDWINYYTEGNYSQEGKSGLSYCLFVKKNDYIFLSNYFYRQTLFDFSLDYNKILSAKTILPMVDKPEFEINLFLLYLTTHQKHNSLQSKPETTPLENLKEISMLPRKEPTISIFSQKNQYRYKPLPLYSYIIKLLTLLIQNPQHVVSEDFFNASFRDEEPSTLKKIISFVKEQPDIFIINDHQIILQSNFVSIIEQTLPFAIDKQIMLEKYVACLEKNQELFFLTKEKFLNQEICFDFIKKLLNRAHAKNHAYAKSPVRYIQVAFYIVAALFPWEGIYKESLAWAVRKILKVSDKLSSHFEEQIIDTVNYYTKNVDDNKNENEAGFFLFTEQNGLIKILDKYKFYYFGESGNLFINYKKILLLNNFLENVENFNEHLENLFFEYIKVETKSAKFTKLNLTYNSKSKKSNRNIDSENMEPIMWLDKIWLKPNNTHYPLLLKIFRAIIESNEIITLEKAIEKTDYHVPNKYKEEIKEILLNSNVFYIDAENRIYMLKASQIALQQVLESEHLDKQTLFEKYINQVSLSPNPMDENLTDIDKEIEKKFLTMPGDSKFIKLAFFTVALSLLRDQRDVLLSDFLTAVTAILNIHEKKDIFKQELLEKLNCYIKKNNSDQMPSAFYLFLEDNNCLKLADYFYDKKPINQNELMHTDKDEAYFSNSSEEAGFLLPNYPYDQDHVYSENESNSSFNRVLNCRRVVAAKDILDSIEQYDQEIEKLFFLYVNELSQSVKDRKVSSPLRHPIEYFQLEGDELPPDQNENSTLGVSEDLKYFNHLIQTFELNNTTATARAASSSPPHPIEHHQLEGDELPPDQNENSTLGVSEDVNYFNHPIQTFELNNTTAIVNENTPVTWPSFYKPLSPSMVQQFDQQQTLSVGKRIRSDTDLPTTNTKVFKR